MTTRYRVTVRADDVELRGHIDDYERVKEIAAALADTGAIVVASVSEDQPDGPVPASRNQVGNDTWEITMSDGTSRFVNGRGEELEVTLGEKS